MGKTFSKIEDALDLPTLNELDDPETPSVSPSDEEIQAALANAENLEKKLKTVDGFEQHDSEMDELAHLAIQSHKDLQELGMEVELRYAGDIFATSAQMLNIAVNAKNLKVEKKLKLLKLKLDKLRIDRMTKTDESATLSGTATVLDRNEMLRLLRDKGSDSNK